MLFNILICIGTFFVALTFSTWVMHNSKTLIKGMNIIFTIGVTLITIGFLFK